jgi:(2R)-3-sulfolactate dehydrogenase (NADP+)
MTRITLTEIKEVARAALISSGTSSANAESVAESICAAEACGIASHGLLRVPIYCAHARSRKVDGFARPVLDNIEGGVAQIDARNGFAHPAIELALEELVNLCHRQGVALACIRNSYNSGVMGHHVEHLASRGFIALGFSNAPATIAPWGGRQPVFGTNPIAFAAPRRGREAIVVDQAASVVARGEVLLRAQKGEAIPDTWGLDSDGVPCTDPLAVLRGGSMAPSGAHKGVALALIVEILSAVLVGPKLSFDAGSLTEDDSREAGLGQMFIAIEPSRLSADYEQRIERLAMIVESQHPARLPGSLRQMRREEAALSGVEVSELLLTRIRDIALRTP